MMLTGVVPELGLRLNQAQSEPGEVVKFIPLEGLVLVTEMLCAAGAAEPKT